MIMRIAILLGLLLGLQANAAAASGSDSLEAARRRLEQLRATCRENHPEVKRQKELIAELELRQRLQARANVELELARARLAGLRKTCKEKHPAVQAQLKKIEELEKQQP